MTIFVAHAPADRQAADALEKFLERRGQFVELDDGETALRPVQSSDVLVLFLSKDFVFAPTRLRLERRALDAWAEGRLVAVKLDKSIAPVGLRDLPAIDASFEAQREFKWQEVADAIRASLKAPPPSDIGVDTKKGGAEPPWRDHLRKQDAVRGSSRRREEADDMRKRVRGHGRIALLSCLLLMLPGLGALAVSGAIFLVNRIGPTPGTLADLIAGIDAFGADRGVPPGVTPAVFVAALVLMVLAPIWLVIAGGMRKRRLNEYAREHPEIGEDYEAAPAPVTTDAMFVSYARANAQTVLPVIEAAKQNGRTFWLDQQNLGTGAGWAGEIVRAIRAAKGVLVMCSKAAFESDHVKREIYLADRYHKRLVPVFLEQADPPEDFEYFFASVQPLNLYETPEAERPEALVRALGTS